VSEGADDLSQLRDFVTRYPRLFVLTGAGVSTDSGIPDYRDRDGQWKRPPPMNFQRFMGAEIDRARYWARSMIGWRRFGAVSPNASHRALAAMETRGQVELLVTQNVDGLHESAGSRHVVDLHGRLDRVVCMQCHSLFDRHDFQGWLEVANPDWVHLDAVQAPDGDADLERDDFADFNVPPCPVCGGILKPDVVFFGENVPRDRVERALAALGRAQAVLVVGSSLMVYSGFRFVRSAAADGKPIAAINLGKTRADDLLTLKVARNSADALTALSD